MQNYYAQLKNREFIGIIRKVYGKDKFGWYEVEVPELLPGQTITVYDASQKHIIDQNSGSFYPLLENQKVVIKFKSNNINSGYIDRICESNVFELAKNGTIDSSKYIIVMTPKNHSISVDNSSNSINILLSGGKSGITMDNNGIKICTKGKIEISANDVIDIKSATNILLHRGSPSCSSSSIKNKTLKEVVSNIDYTPSTDFDISPSMLYTAADNIIENEEAADNIDIEDVKDNVKKLFDKLTTKLDNITQNLNSLFDKSNETVSNLDDKLNDKLNELKDNIIQLDGTLLEVEGSVSIPNSVYKFLKFSKYFYNTASGENYFSLSDEELNELEEHHERLKLYSKETQSRISEICSQIQSKIRNEYADAINRVKDAVNKIKKYTLDVLGEKFIKSVENWNKNIKEAQENIDKKLKELAKIDESSILTCKDADRLNEYSKNVKKNIDDMHREVDKMINTYQGIKNMSNVLKSQNNKSILGHYLENFANQKIAALNTLSQKLSDIKNLLSEPHSNLNEQRHKIKKAVHDAKNSANEVLSKKDDFEIDKHTLSKTMEFEYQNVLCDLLDMLSNLELGLDLNFGLEFHIPDFILNLIPDLNISLQESAVAAGGGFSACASINPCKGGSLSFDLNLMLPIEDLINLLLSTLLAPIFKLLMAIANLIKEIKELLSKKFALNFGISIHLSLGIFKDLLSFLNREFKACIGMNMKLLAKGLTFRI